MTLILYNKTLEKAFLPLCEKLNRELSLLGEACRILDNRTAWKLKKEDAEFSGCIFLDKDMLLGQRLEQWGIRLFNNLGSIEICDDKRKTTEFIREFFKVPETVCYPLLYTPDPAFFERFAKETAEVLSLPVVAKLAFGSWGQQVFLLHTVHEMIDFQKKYYATPHLYCQLIPESLGKDVRVYCAGGKAVAAISRENRNDFRSNIALGGSAQPHTLTPNEKNAAEDVCRFLNLDFGGVDLLFSEDDVPYICEVNSNAIFTETERVSGVNIARNIAETVKKAIDNLHPCEKETDFLFS